MSLLSFLYFVDIALDFELQRQDIALKSEHEILLRIVACPTGYCFGFKTLQTGRAKTNSFNSFCVVQQ